MTGGKNLKLIGATWGDPHSASTYSGIPYHLFEELTRTGHLVGRASLKQSRPTDVFRGALDLQRSWQARAVRRNAFWRYLPETIALLSQRMEPRYAQFPEHDALVQFGVAGLPNSECPLMSHVEITVETAASTEVFARSYGFLDSDRRWLQRAIEGERMFLSRCSLVWTMSRWTAQGLRRQGVAEDKLWIHAPGCAISNSAPPERDWRAPHLLFVGKDWVRKGGPLLVEAFRKFRRHFPSSALTIIGCSPRVNGDGIRVLGFLDKQNPAHATVLADAYREATIFCMPSAWESTGIVYMEAAQHGLPVVMLAGQGREDIFLDSMGLALKDPGADDLAEALVELASDPERMEAMGRAGRKHIEENYSWEVVANRLRDRISSTLSLTRSPMAAVAPG